MSDQTHDLRLGYLRLLSEAGLGNFEKLWPGQPQELREKLVEANASLGILQEMPDEDLVNRLVEVAKERRFGVVLTSDLPGEYDTSFWQAVSLSSTGSGNFESFYDGERAESDLPGDEAAEPPGDDDTPYWGDEG